VQVLDLVRPPGDSDLAPFGGESRMMSFFFRRGANRVGEGNRILEVLELELPI
jgi:hypothetical protein